MTIIRKYDYDENEITAITKDSSENLWLGFKKESDGYCYVKKVSKQNPYIILADEIEIEADNINHMSFISGYINLALDSSYFGCRVSYTNPYGAKFYIDYETGINEAPIAVVLMNQGGTDYSFYLLPGILSGEVAKVVKYRYSTYYETIELEKSGEIIRNAKNIVSDGNENLWIVTGDNPSKLVIVYNPGSGFTFDVINLTI